MVVPLSLLNASRSGGENWSWGMQIYIKGHSIVAYDLWI